MRFTALVIFAAVTLGSLAQAAEGLSVGYKEGGGGFFVKSGDDLKFSLLGYAQAQQTWFISSTYKAANTNAPVDFSITRARLDFIADFFKDYQLLIETDAAPQGGGLVLAQITARLVEDALKLTAGKFVVPFSTEGYRSSRDFDTINRHQTLNTLYFLPSQDVQYGLMLSGKVAEGKLGWFLSVTNGNAGVTANVPSSGPFVKEWDAKATYDFSNDLKVGLAVQMARLPAGSVPLVDLTYTTYNKISGVGGKRIGFTPDIYLNFDNLSIRSEFIYMKWSDSAGSPSLWGGFAQVAYFVTGDKSKGFQPLIRAEFTKLNGPLDTPGSDHLLALLAGWNWFLNGNVRHQLNVIATLPGGATPGVYADNGTKLALLSELQFKF